MNSDKMELQTRTSGLLLHPTSLPGRFGVGDLGQEAHRFVDFLASSSQRLWQMLPLGPAHEEGFSPYSALSGFAGSPLLISPERLWQQGLIAEENLQQGLLLPSRRVDFHRALEWKEALLARACHAFHQRASRRERQQFEQFCHEASSWLDDYALFMALRSRLHKAPWYWWEEGLRRRERGALVSTRRHLAADIAFHQYIQFEFARQWKDLRRHAHACGIALVGDVPLYVAYDSADVWAHPEYFLLEEDALLPIFEAGTPPDDCFPGEGQHWGHPVYAWERLEKEDFGWWVERLRRSLERFDFVRLDHFRGFEAFWAIPRGSSPLQGHWRPGPGSHFFSTLQHALGDLPIIAEDLGFITPAVHLLRETFSLPGMFVLQFACTTPGDDALLSDGCQPHCVAYTATHDTDTTAGWFKSLQGAQRQTARAYLGPPGPEGIHWDAIRRVWGLPACWALAPLQDVVGLDSQGRMNVPGTCSSRNWSWRFSWEELPDSLGEQLACLTYACNRG
jgi:4-alpha-glucanotransferase